MIGTPSKSRGIHVVAAVKNRPGKRVHARPAGQVGFALPTAGDHELSAAIGAGVRLHLPHTIIPANATVHLSAEFRSQVERASVVLEILPYLLSRRVCRIRGREGPVRQCGVALGRVKVQPLVVAVPGRTDTFGALEHHERHIRAPEGGADRESRRPRPNDDGVGLRHRYAILQQSWIEWADGRPDLRPNSSTGMAGLASGARRQSRG